MKMSNETSSASTNATLRRVVTSELQHSIITTDFKMRSNEIITEIMSNLSLTNCTLDGCGCGYGQNNSSMGVGEGWWSDEEGDDVYRHSRPVTFILILAYGLILAIGVVGNSLVVGVVLKSPRMRTVTNLFILNLAVADLLVILFCLPPTLLSNILVPWVLGWWMCKTVPYVQGVSVCASVYSLVAVSLDRCSAIWFSLGGGFTRRKARLIILLIWCVSCTLALPWALYFELDAPDPDNHPSMQFCLEKWPPGMDGDLYFLIGNLVFCYILPLIVISICYLLIWLRVIYRNVPTDSVATLQKIHHKAKIGVLKMLVVVVLIFLLSWLPLYGIFARIKLGSPLSQWESNVFAIATPIAQWLGSSNSALNPIIYAALNVKFRRAFLYLLPKCCNNHPPCHPNMNKSSLMQRNHTSLYNVTTGV